MANQHESYHRKLFSISFVYVSSQVTSCKTLMSHTLILVSLCLIPPQNCIGNAPCLLCIPVGNSWEDVHMSDGFVSLRMWPLTPFIFVATGDTGKVANVQVNYLPIVHKMVWAIQFNYKLASVPKQSFHYTDQRSCAWGALAPLLTLSHPMSVLPWGGKSYHWALDLKYVWLLYKCTYSVPPLFHLLYLFKVAYLENN